MTTVKNKSRNKAETLLCRVSEMGTISPVFRNLPPTKVPTSGSIKGFEGLEGRLMQLTVCLLEREGPSNSAIDELKEANLDLIKSEDAIDYSRRLDIILNLIRKL